jgi:hypothetical protein
MSANAGWITLRFISKKRKKGKSLYQFLMGGRGTAARRHKSPKLRDSRQMSVDLLSRP